MRSRLLPGGLAFVLCAASGCVPDATPDDTAARPVTGDATCSIGADVSVTDDRGAAAVVTVRARDSAVLVAHLAIDVDPGTMNLGAAEVLVDSGWSAPAAEMAVLACGPSAHVALDGWSLDDRELVLACGGRADRTDREVRLRSLDELPGALETCPAERWLWLWTPSTCDELRRLPEATDGVHLVDLDHEEPAPRIEVGCVFDRDRDEGWTRVLGFESEPRQPAPPVDAPLSLELGLPRAARFSGSVDPEELRAFPSRLPSPTLRFRCDKQGRGLDFRTVRSSVFDFLTGATDEQPLAQGSIASEYGVPGAQENLMRHQELWGCLGPPACTVPDGCRWAGLWGGCAIVPARDRLLVRPLFVEEYGDEIPYAAWNLRGERLCDDDVDGAGTWEVLIR